jgi:hypothetical protein
MRGRARCPDARAKPVSRAPRAPRTDDGGGLRVRDLCRARCEQAGGKKKVRERVAFVFGRGGGKGALGRLEQYSQTKLKNPKPQPSGPPPNKKGGTSSRSKVNP